MRILVMGTGGVGGFVGARLVETGHDVTFVARGAHLDALRNHGLTLRGDTASRKLHPIRVVGSPVEAGTDFELVLFTVKCYDTGEASLALRPVVGEATTVLTLQNGIDSVPMLSTVLGEGRVVGGATWLTAHIEAPGVIQYQDALVRAVIGEPDGEETPRVCSIANALQACGIETEVSCEIERVLWNKVVLLAVHGGMSSVCQLPLGDILATEGMRDVYQHMFAEAVDVASASGVALPPATAVQLSELLASAPPDNTTSLQVDFGRRGRVELEYLTGAVVRRGRALNVETPALEAIYVALKAQARAFGGLGEAPPLS